MQIFPLKVNKASVSSLSTLCLLLKFLRTMSSIPSLASTFSGLMDLMGCLISFLKFLLQYYHPVWPNSSVSAFQYPSFLPAATMWAEPVIKKGDCSNPLNYHPTPLLFCLFKAFENIVKKKEKINSIHARLTFLIVSLGSARDTLLMILPS